MILRHHITCWHAWHACDSNLPSIVDCNLPYQKGQHAKYYNNEKELGGSVHYYYAWPSHDGHQLWQSGTHDADYNTNIDRWQGMCAACLHLSAWRTHALHMNVIICHHGMHVISTCLLKLIANCQHREFGVASCIVANAWCMTNLAGSQTSSVVSAWRMLGLLGLPSA